MLFSFLRKIYKHLLFYCFSFIIIFLIFFLTQLPMKPVLYALMLCGTVGFVVLLVDFFRFSKRYHLLRSTDFSEAISLLPETGDPIEQLYQQKLHQLASAKQQAVLDSNAQQKAMMDYYTTWVHQIKTPIAAMNLILQEQGNQQELEGELFKIRQYVDMVLSYQRLEAEDFVFRSLALDSVIRNAIRSSSGQFIRQKVALRFEETGIELVSDEKWLQFVLEQLLSNCLKYAPGGSVSIYRSATNVLTIADNGIGILPEDMPRIFEMGYTGINGRSTRATTGLGLYLCHEIITHLGHQISISSTPGQGTAVTLDFSYRKLSFE